MVYPLEEMLAFKKDHPDLYMYYQMDTHWNNLGGYIGARVLLTELSIEISPLDQMEISYEEKSDGDLKSLLNLWGVSQNRPDPVLNRRDGAHPVTICEAYSGRSEYEMQGVPQLSLMMYRDSFGIDLAAHLKYHLSRTVLLHNSIYEKRCVDEEKPDVFVLEILERNIGRLRYLEL